MARVTNLMNIAVSGKVGNVVFCNGPVRGSYTRTLPKKSEVRSEKQLNTQNKVAIANRFLNPLRSLIEEVWQKDRYTRKTAFGSAFSHMMKHAFRGGYMEEEIIYSEVLFSRGLLIKPEGLTARRERTRVEVVWEENARSGVDALPEDKTVLVIYNETKEMSISINGTAVRGDGRMIAELPPVYGTDRLHAYLFFVNRNRRWASDNVYAGCLE